MLERLDEVPWSTLTHAYGSALDVPDLLRALASDDPGEREAALSELHGSVWHQGTVYPATPHVVPLLLELLAEPELAGKAGLLRYLAQLTGGQAEEPGLAARVVDAVRQGRPIYEVLLDDPTADVRPAAASLLGALAPGTTAPASRVDPDDGPGDLDEAAQTALQALAAAEVAAPAPATDVEGEARRVRLTALGLSLLFLAVVALLVALALSSRPGV